MGSAGVSFSNPNEINSLSHIFLELDLSLVAIRKAHDDLMKLPLHNSEIDACIVGLALFHRQVTDLVYRGEQLVRELDPQKTKEVKHGKKRATRPRPDSTKRQMVRPAVS